MSAIEGTIVSTAMPSIVASLNGLELMNWVFSIYLLMGAVMTPIYGKLADKLGRKPIFIIGISLFVVGSFLCSLAPNMIFLIIARFIQGIGAGAILPISMTIIADMYSAEKRASIIGLNNAAWGIASIIAPMIGGFLVEKISWHWIFLINVPIGIIVLLCIYFGLHENRQRANRQPMDLKGTFLLAISLISFLYFFQVTGEEVNAFFKPSYLLILLFSLVVFYLFLKVERKAIDPIVSLDLFKSNVFVVISIVTFLISGFLISLDVYVPMWLQLLNNESATSSGMALASMSIMWMLGSFLVGKLINKISIIKILWIGTFCLCISSTFMINFSISTSYWTFVLLGLLLGIGFGMSVTTTTIGVQEQVHESQLGTATSLNTLFRTIGQSIMVALYGMTMNISLLNSHDKYPVIDNDLLNKYLNIQTRNTVPQHAIHDIKIIVHHMLHNIYVLAFITVLCSFILVSSLVIRNYLLQKYK